MDIEALEHALVELSPQLAGRGEVVALGVREQGAEVVELLDDELTARRVFLNLCLSGRPFGGDAGLLDLEVIERNRVGVVRLEEPVTLPGEVLERALRLHLRRGLCGEDGVEVAEHDLPD